MSALGASGGRAMLDRLARTLPRPGRGMVTTIMKGRPTKATIGRTVTVTTRWIMTIAGQAPTFLTAPPVIT